MSNSKWYAFKCWLAAKVAKCLPDGVRRFVLYELQERALAVPSKDKPPIRGGDWEVTFHQMYLQLKD